MSKTKLFKILEGYFIGRDPAVYSKDEIDDALSLMVKLAAWLGDGKGRKRI